jgi:hypothetical protein
MIEKKKLNGKRIAIFAGALLVLSLSLVAYVSYPTSTVRSQSPSGNSLGIVGAGGSEDYYNYSSPVTLKQASSSINYSLVMPSYLPTGVSFVGARLINASNQLYLMYSVNGSQLITASSTGGLLIVEESTDSNPLPGPVIVTPAVVATTITTISSTSYTVATSIVAPASTISSGWDNTTLAGQSVLVGAISGLAQVQWWHNHVWIHLWGFMPLQALENIAQSMMASPTASSSSDSN